MVIARKIFVIIFSVMLMLLFNEKVKAQAKSDITLSGRVFSAVTGKPVEFGSVTVVEAKKRAFTQNDGSYRVSFLSPGEYTIVVRSDELKTLTIKMNITRDTVRDFYLQPLTVKGEGLLITASRDVQKISRYTMTLKELKDVPGSFGDSVNALTSLPGVIRTSGLFGPLVIRGADLIRNRYLIDEIPIYNPLHFGGIHSVINNNIISEIDLYASAFPAQFGFANAAIININTIDDVKEFGGYTDVGLISACALIYTPLLRDSLGELQFATPSYVPQQNDDSAQAGYLIASGRVGYLSLFVPAIYEFVTGEEVPFVPEYWDYQVKMKYNFSASHSLTLLLMGSSDYLTFDEEKTKVVNPDEGDDPLLEGFKAKADWSSHSQGLYYTWQPHERFWNKIMLYAAFVKYYSYFTLTSDYAASWLKDVTIDSRPYIFGAKEIFGSELLKDFLRVKGGLEYTYFYFVANGKTIMPKTQQTGIDVGNENAFAIVPLNEKIVNTTVGGYLQPKILFWWFVVEPGIRVDYLNRTEQTIVDPRGVASIEFPSDTILSFAMGRYSYFFQINQYLFIQNPQVTKADEDLKPERAIHRVMAIEQKCGDYTVRAEGFYNNYYDLAVAYYHYGPDGKPRDGMSTGQQKAYGFEIMIKKDLRENETGIYG
ncbi:MAG: TonB-dependent receptor, partial [Spirochaetes bacterium]|nr:TonB-dependent receptor [Spirochaetota bacterium]